MEKFVVQWNNSDASLDKMHKLFARSVYGCQPSPDGTLVVWNQETAEAVDRVTPGMYLWLTYGVLFKSNVHPLSAEVRQTFGFMPQFQELVSQIEKDNYVSRAEAYNKLIAASQSLCASIQNPASTQQLMQQFGQACDALSVVLTEVSDSIEEWGDEDEHPNNRTTDC